MRSVFGYGARLLMICGLAFSPVISSAKNTSTVDPARDISQIKVDQQQLLQAVASRTLSWLTGSSSNNDYVSVGRVANFFGFVGLRVSSNHSLSRSGVAKDTLHVLNGSQREALISLVETQKNVFEQVHSARHNMNRALEELLVGETVSREEFLELGRVYGASEAELGRTIAQTLGQVAQTLTPAQNIALPEIRKKHLSGNVSKVKRRGVKTKLSKVDKKELVNIAARFLSWTTGNQEFNDFEVVGKPSQHFGFVSLRIESNHGIKRGAVANEVLALLTSTQQDALNAAATHNSEAFQGFLDVRGQLMRTLEVALAGDVIDADKINLLGAAMGEVEADMTWAQALAMLDVRNTMTETQMTALLDMRAKYTGGRLRELPGDPFMRGRQLYAQCALCHTDSNVNGVGPSLSKIVNRPIAGDVGFENYSSGMRAYAEIHDQWNETLLDQFLQSPRKEIPGTYMGYGGLENSEDRAALITYLKERD